MVPYGAKGEGKERKPRNDHKTHRSKKKRINDTKWRKKLETNEETPGRGNNDPANNDPKTAQR